MRWAPEGWVRVLFSIGVDLVVAFWVGAPEVMLRTVSTALFSLFIVIFPSARVWLFFSFCWIFVLLLCGKCAVLSLLPYRVSFDLSSFSPLLLPFFWIGFSLLLILLDNVANYYIA